MHSGIVKNKPRMEVNAVIKHAVMWVCYCLDAGSRKDAALKFADTTYHAKLDKREVL